MRIVVFLAAALTTTPAFAQYLTDLAATRDGSTLYFSYLRSSTTPDNQIYRWTSAGGVSLFADRPGEHLYGTQTTYEGTVLHHAEQRCAAGTGPGFNTCSIGETQITIPGIEPFRVSGFLLISPNGRYGVFATFDTRALWVDWFTGEEIWVDFPFRSIPNLTPPFSVNQHAIANNGSFLIGASGAPGVRVWSKSGEIVLPATDLIENAAISADGSTVSVTAREPGSGSPTSPTYVHDLASGRKTKFAQLVSMSDDGQTVAYLTEDPRSISSRAQAVVSRSDGTGARQITSVSDGVRSVIISGDARYIFVVVGKNAALSEKSQLQRYNLETGAVDDLPAVP